MRILTKDGEYEIAPDLVQAYKVAHPSIDVDRQFALMRIWLESNKAGRPKNPVRFVQSWFRRCKTSRFQPVSTFDRNLSIVSRLTGADKQQDEGHAIARPAARRIG